MLALCLILRVVFTSIPASAAEVPLMYVCDETRVVRVELELSATRIQTVGDPEEVVTGLRICNGVAVDPGENLLFWTDMGEKGIYRKRIGEGSVTDKELITDTDVIYPMGVAEDRLTKRVYWADTHTHKISSAAYDGSDRRDIATSSLDQPMPIIVDPVQKFLYWTDWGDPNKIERSDLDGANRQVIVSSSSCNRRLGRSPVGLAIDFAEARLYWLDNSDRDIASCLLNGEEGRKVMDTHVKVFGFVFFQDWLLWTGWGDDAVFAATKSGTEFHTVLADLQGTHGIAVVNQYIGDYNRDIDTDLFGDVNVTSDLRYEDTTQGQKVFHTPYLEFTCNFHIEGVYFYFVDWYVDNERVHECGPVREHQRHRTNLNESLLTSLGFSLGITIKCDVRASTNETGVASRRKSSGGFFAGTRVHFSEEGLIVRKGQISTIQLENTVPIGCEVEDGLDEEDCTPTIELYDPNDDYSCKHTTLSVLSNSGQCGTDFSAFRYNDWFSLNQGATPCLTPDCAERKYATSFMNVTTKNDALYDNRGGFNIRLRAKTKHTIWNSYSNTDLTVVLAGERAWQRRVCSSHIDPHMTTADGWRYENQRTGYFVIYRNPKYKTEVQERTIPCRNAFCTCAVIVRSGGDMFEVNVCGKNRFRNFIRCEDSILEARSRSDTRYSIHTPYGTIIEVTVRKWRGGTYLNLDVYMSPKDWNNVEGLCGHFNGDVTDDFRLSDGRVVRHSCGNRWRCQFDTTEFANSWRVDVASQTFFDSRNHNPTKWPAAESLCVCPHVLGGPVENGEPVCLPNEYMSCTRTDGSVFKGRKIECDTERTNRSSEAYHREVNERYNLNSVANRFPRVQRDTETVNYTFEQGIEECYAYFAAKSMYLQFIGTLPESDANETLVMECALDYPYGAVSDELKESHFGTWLARIENEMDRDVTFQEENPDVVLNFAALNCPDDCGGHGLCNNGVCECDSDYGGESCDVLRSAPLQLLLVEGGALCDRQEGACTTFRVYSEGILPNFVCRVAETKKYGSNVPDDVNVMAGSGNRISYFEGECFIATSETRRKRSSSISQEPYITTLDISLSNDGSSYGDPERVYVYDSLCQQYTSVDGEYTFVVKAGFCYIDGVCQVADSRAPTDDCYVCDPAVSNTTWTSTCVSDETTSDHTGLIVGAALGGLGLALIVAAVAFLVLKHRQNRKERVSPSEDSRAGGVPPAIQYVSPTVAYDNSTRTVTSSTGCHSASAVTLQFEAHKPAF